MDATGQSPLRIDIITVRDPDCENEYQVFADGVPTQQDSAVPLRSHHGAVMVSIHDVDLGYAELGDQDEFADWGWFAFYVGARGRAETSLPEAVRVSLMDQVEQTAGRYGHDLYALAVEHYETCRTPGCWAPTDDGQGWDGMCGNCADRAEAKAES